MTVIFHMTPESTRDKREWDKWPELAGHFVRAFNAKITVVGGMKDIPYVDRNFMPQTRAIHDHIWNMTGETRLDELIELVRSCDLLVCVNSFVMHLGVALGVKMFAIVGATEPKVVLPPGIPHAYSLYVKDIPLQTVLDGIMEAMK